MKQEFRICVNPVGQGEYLLRTEQVAPGVPMAQELANWPVEDWLMQTEYLLLGKGTTHSTNCLDIFTLGQQLYCALFQGSLKESWLMAQTIAQDQQDGLRLRLGIEESRLARLPWEALHTGDHPLATDPFIAFSRYQTNAKPAHVDQERNVQAATLQQAGVKVLMVMAAPTAQASLANKPLVDLEFTVLDQPEKAQLTPTFEQEQYQILHYVGYSQFGPAGGKLCLTSGKISLSETLSGDELAELLVKNGTQMVVLNSCCDYTVAEPNTDASFYNLTQRLLERGVRSVLATAKPIPDQVALTLIQLFYRHLSQGHPIDLSLSRARAGLISAYGFDQLYWALPILYLQPEFDGYLDATVGLELLGEEDWEEPFDKTESQDPTYQQDAALVLDLLRQLDTVEPLPVPSEPLTQLTVAKDETRHPQASPTLASAPLSLPRTKAVSNIKSAKESVDIAWLASGIVGLLAIALGIWWYQGMFPKASNTPASESQIQLKDRYHPKALKQSQLQHSRL
ncbi:MAG: CHAT domain-containing protein [Chroococcidiopsidaceae cyanobacterium CP_BM_ER_R8_30]|nr:CHAT domain-containing protein [Chroococcidiopsidaceae cyanobacterium CP_BM_ER_R8_30]